MNLLWTDEAWEDYRYWQIQDKKTLKRINQIVRDIQRSPYAGIGKPAPLKGDLSGWWSRRIDGANRIVYRLKNDTVEITQSKGHYGS
jgi:toxin YoeB